MTALSRLRALTATDADRLLALIVACDIAVLGEPDYTAEDVADDLSRPTWRGWAVDEPDGSLRAYCWVEKVPGRPYVGGEVRVRPDLPGDLGAELFTFVRTQAAEVDPQLPLHVMTAAAAVRDRGWLDAAGGKVIRHYYRMVIDLPDEPPADPQPPPGVTVDRVDDVDEQLRVVHRVIDTSFLDHFGGFATDYDIWLARQRRGSGADIGLWRLASVDGAPAAVLIGRAWPDTGWIQALGTLREFRKRGLGRLLLQEAFAEFHRRGYRRVSLGVDATNPTGAVALYESVGMRVLDEAVLYEFAP